MPVVPHSPCNLLKIQQERRCTTLHRMQMFNVGLLISNEGECKKQYMTLNTKTKFNRTLHQKKVFVNAGRIVWAYFKSSFIYPLMVVKSETRKESIVACLMR